MLGIATAHALANAGLRELTLLDARAPMSLTSAHSGENFRSWWPQPELAALMARSIALMETYCAREGIRMTRRGYAYATRTHDSNSLLDTLRSDYDLDAIGGLRIHTPEDCANYVPGDYQCVAPAMGGADVLLGHPLIASRFPGLDPAVNALVHVRQAGDVDSQAMASRMLARVRDDGGVLRRATVTDVVRRSNGEYAVTVDSDQARETLAGDVLVNAAGPFAGAIAERLGVSLPLVCVAQQKLAFEDTAGVVPRDAPFTIDLDGQRLAFDDDERDALATSQDTAWLLQAFPGGIHCRPEGGLNGRWIKLGWAFSQTEHPPQWDAPLNDHFPEIVLRGAARLRPGLAQYLERLPRARTHYGGYYTKTRENWPIIGALDDAGAYVVAGLSGYGTMAACAAGELIADCVLERALPGYAHALSLERYKDAALMNRIIACAKSGEL